MKNTYNSKFKYAAFGIIFGSLFPVLATIIDLKDSALPLCLFNIFILHITEPLHLIIDTAPFFLGLFAFLIGYKQDKSDYNNQLYNESMEKNMRNLSYLNQELEKSEKRFHDIALSSVDWIWEVDKNGKYTFATGKVKEILGYKPEELIGKTPFDLMPEDEARRVGEEFVEIISEKLPIEGLINWNITKSGEKVCLLTDGVPIFDTNGEFLGYRGVDKDITKSIKDEEQKNKLQAQLERAKRMESLGVLAGGVAHDLNNMLGPVVAYPDFIAEKLPEDSPLKKQVLSIKIAAKRAAAVIQDLLTLARRGRYEMSSLDLNQIIESYIKSPIHIKFADEHPDILVTLDLDMSINNINGSFHHLSKVIMNLILNAFDAMPTGGELTIQTSQRQMEKLYGGYNKIEHGEYAILSIKDSGMGIAPEDLNKIFEPYFSKKSMTTSGSGLGLSVVYGVIKDHKGYYDVFSDVGKGTEFVIYFPIVNEKKQIEEPKKIIDNRGIESLLIVDDNKEQREVGTLLLSDLGYIVNSVTNGREGVEYIKNNSVDLILLDMIMEDDFDGYDTYCEIIKFKPEQKIIIVSGYSATSKVIEMQKMGAGPYLKKPYTRDQVAGAIRQYLDKTPVINSTIQ